MRYFIIYMIGRVSFTYDCADYGLHLILFFSLALAMTQLWPVTAPIGAYLLEEHF